MKARALINVNRNNDAVEALNRVIAYDPTHVEALQTIDIALRVDPNDGEALTMKSAILDDMGRYREARSLLHRALEIDPANEIASEGLEEMNRNNHW